MIQLRLSLGSSVAQLPSAAPHMYSIRLQPSFCIPWLHSTASLCAGDSAGIMGGQGSCTEGGARLPHEASQHLGSLSYSQQPSTQLPASRHSFRRHACGGAAGGSFPRERAGPCGELCATHPRGRGCPTPRLPIQDPGGTQLLALFGRRG